MLKSTSTTAAKVARGTWHTHNPRPVAKRNGSFKNYFAKAYTGSGSWSSIG